MATRQSIEFDFRKALNQADRIDAAADELNTLAQNRFSDTMQQLSANWKGENASLYLSKGGELQEEMNATAKELRNIATDVRTVARRLYNAEMEALRIAQTRDY